MEKSSSMNNNSMRRGVFSNNNERMSSSGLVVSGDQEESGWTMYFDDYFNEHNYNIHGENSSSMISIGEDHHLESSLISDAASSAAKKLAHGHHHDHEKQHVIGFSLDKRTCHRSSSLKKRKTKVVLHDDALEDTASSPANSPKVYDFMNQFDRKPQEKNLMDISQERAGGSSSRNLQINERSGYGSITVGHNGRDNDTTELKKKGLCLFPLSMIVNYLD